MLTPFYEIIAFLLFTLIAAAVVVLMIYIYMLIIEFTDLLINKIENQFNDSRRKRSP